MVHHVVALSSCHISILSDCNTNRVRIVGYPSFGWSYCARVPIHILEGPHRQEQPGTTRVTLRFQGPLMNYQANDCSYSKWEFWRKKKPKTQNCSNVSVHLNETLVCNLSLRNLPKSSPPLPCNLQSTVHSSHIYSSPLTKSANFFDHFTKFTSSPVKYIPVEKINSQLQNYFSQTSRPYCFGMNFSDQGSKIFCKP